MKTNNRKGSQGFGTVEIVLITAVLIALAMMFRTAIMSYAKRLMDDVFEQDQISIAEGIQSNDE